MNTNFRNLLEVRIKEEVLDKGNSFVESRNDSIHEVGISRGYLMALKDVLEWSQEIARKINDA